jgi:hypothetical protein
VAFPDFVRAVECSLLNDGLLLMGANRGDRWRGTSYGRLTEL